MIELGTRVSIDAAGVARCLGLQTEARIGIPEINAALEQKIGREILFPPVSAAAQTADGRGHSQAVCIAYRPSFFVSLHPHHSHDFRSRLPCAAKPASDRMRYGQPWWTDTNTTLAANCGELRAIDESIKMARRTFFSFHYQPDIWRAMNVRNSWVITDDQDDRGFFDSSVFEATRRTSEDALKRFLREGLANTSVTCVLTGSQTWKRRWVKYEIARSIVKGNGLLNVHIHGLKNQDEETATKGANPLDGMGLYKTNGKILLAEWNGKKWVQYNDHKSPIPESDLWFSPPTTTKVVRLSRHCQSYDFVGDAGRKRIGDWIELAAQVAGR